MSSKKEKIHKNKRQMTYREKFLQCMVCDKQRSLSNQLEKDRKIGQGHDRVTTNEKDANVPKYMKICSVSALIK